MKFTGQILHTKILQMLQSGYRPFFFFDFDGTLTDIVATPDEVDLKPIARYMLEQLAKSFPVAVVSGRRMSEVKKLVGVKGIYYSGNHGVEIEGPGISFVENRSAKSVPYIAELAGEIARKVKRYAPRINSKGYSISVHYRTAEPATVKKLLAHLNAILVGPVNTGKVEVFHGKKVVEIKAPVRWDKGNAIELIMKRASRKGKPIFFGDDTTDEFGFKRVNRIGGMSVFVGKSGHVTSATYRIPSPSALIGELAEFLFRAE